MSTPAAPLDIAQAAKGPAHDQIIMDISNHNDNFAVGLASEQIAKEQAQDIVENVLNNLPDRDEEQSTANVPTIEPLPDDLSTDEEFVDAENDECDAANATIPADNIDEFAPLVCAAKAHQQEADDDAATAAATKITMQKMLDQYGATKLQQMLIALDNREEEQQHEPEAGWSCPVCTYINPPERPGCAMCTEAFRPVAQTDNSTDSDPNHWSCTVCTYRNGVERPGCEMCSAERPATNGGRLLDLHAQLLVMQSDASIARNRRASIECPICFADVPAGGGCILADCLHAFCTECLVQTIQHSVRSDVRCPYACGEYSCEGVLLDGEIRALLSAEQYATYLQQSLREAERQATNAFHCVGDDCAGWWLLPDERAGENGAQFECPVCRQMNCIDCKVC